MDNQTRPLITEDNVATGETVTRPMNDEEYASWLRIQELDPVE
jgi:hypothetical protein